MTLPKSGGPEWVGSQATPYTTVNESLRRLDGGANHYPVVDKDLTSPPGSCADGAVYIVGPSPTGAWAGHEGDIAQAFGVNAASGWRFRDPEEGVLAWVQDEDKLYKCSTGTSPASWAEYAPGGNPTESIIVAVDDETTAITTGTAKVTFRMPYAFTLSAVRASLTTASSSGAPQVDINEGGASILSTRILIDQGATTSVGSSPQPVISDSALADNAEMTIDIDAAGTGAAGLKVYLIGNRP